MILADLQIDGQTRKVLMQAPKNGVFYVLDRTNGALISANPYTYVNWMSGIDKKTGRPRSVLADPGCRVRQLTTNHHVGVLDQIAVETLHQLQKGRFFIGPVWQLGVTNGEIVDLSPNVEVVIIGHNPARCIMCC